MHISWHGYHTTKIQFGDNLLVFNPHSSFRGKASIVALTNPENADTSHSSGVQGDPLILNTPGEYSFHGSSCHALAWRGDNNVEQSLQRWTIEGMVVLYVGTLDRPLENGELQELEKIPIDILIVPVGGGNALDAAQAVKLVTTIEPRVVIPINYARSSKEADLKPVTTFAKEMGANSSDAMPKIVLKKSKLPVDETEVVILSG